MKKGSMFNLFTISSVVFVTLALTYAQFASPADKANNEATSEATNVSVSLSNDVVGLGEQIIVNINVEPCTAIAGMQFDISFNPSLVIADSIDEGDLLTQDGANAYFIPGKIDNEAGTIKGIYGAIVSPGETVSTEGTFAHITLTAVMEGVNCPLTLSNLIIGDLNGSSVPVKVINGEVTLN